MRKTEVLKKIKPKFFFTKNDQDPILKSRLLFLKDFLSRMYLNQSAMNTLSHNFQYTLPYRTVVSASGNFFRKKQARMYMMCTDVRH
jgi:hypothetical protein